MFKPITALDEVLALRHAGLLWVSGCVDPPACIPPVCREIERHHQEELLAYGCKYYILLEE